MDLQSLVKEIQELIDIVSVRKISEMSGDDLSKMALKLASYNATLGSFIAEHEREADLKEASHEMIREQAYKVWREKDKTVADADNYKRTQGHESKLEWIEAKYQYRTLSILRADVSNMIDAIRSRLSQLKQERSQSA